MTTTASTLEAPRQVEPFPCPESHKHGGSLVCFNHHGCRCLDCRANKVHANDRRLAADHKPCERCGIVRRHKAGRINLCRDCASVLTPPERERWL